MTADSCCWACRSPTGVCLSRWQCEHHREAERADEATHTQTHRDPTGNRAVNNVMRERKRR